MHIAMLSVHSSPLARLGGKEAGGMNVYVRELAQEFGRRGATVDIFTRQQQPDMPEYVAPAPGVRVVPVPAGPVAPYDKNLILEHLEECIDGICRFAERHHIAYDIIHSHYFVSGAVALRLRHRWHIPIVQMFHTLGAMKNQVARSDEETETGGRIAIERRLLHEVDAVVAATPIDRDQMVAHYAADPSRIHIIPCGVNTHTFQPQPRQDARARLGLARDKHLLLCVGRMEPLKGIDTLIRAVALLREQEPAHYARVQLLIVGGEPASQPAHWNSEQRRLTALAAELGITQAVTFLGAQPHSALPDYYAAADLLAMPSHYESFGMVALEALACGTPVIASAVGGLKLLIEDGSSGLLVPPGDPHALADRLCLLLVNQQRAVDMAFAARQRALLYSWQQVAEQISRLFDNLSQQHIPTTH
jgi:D-inositol-3-phosphate glycosyltransferase